MCIRDRALTRVSQVLQDLQPDLVLAQGETTTVMVAGLASCYAQIPMGHVEAGLRTHRRYSPFPEEMNRRLVASLASLHFAPTSRAVAALQAEGVPAEDIFLTGNTVVDALQSIATQPFEPDPALHARLEQTPGRLLLVTAHRRENFGGSFEAICRAIAELARRFPEVRFVYTVHLNPNVREPVNRILDPRQFSNVRLLDPLPYREFIALFRRAVLVLSDSGGVQEEAPTLGTPVLLMRDTTERPEAVDAGTVRLVGTDEDVIVHSVTELLTDRLAYRAMAQAVNPYGGGRAAQRCVRAMEHFFGLCARPDEFVPADHLAVA